MCQSKQELRASWKFWFKQNIHTFRGNKEHKVGSLYALVIVSGLHLQITVRRFCHWDFCPVIFFQPPCHLHCLQIPSTFPVSAFSAHVTLSSLAVYRAEINVEQCTVCILKISFPLNVAIFLCLHCSYYP